MICKVELYFEIEKQPGEDFPQHPQLILEKLISKNKNFEKIIIKEPAFGDIEDNPLIQATYLTRERALIKLIGKK